MMTPVSRDCPLLPNDLIIEILLRFPVKTLLRFKSVCKAWQTIISSSWFQYKHFGRESNCRDLIVCWSGLLSIENDDEDYPTFDPTFEDVGSVSCFPNGILESNPMELHMGHSEGVVSHVCGPCNGIICVRYSNCTYALWNPATKKSWSIPEHPLIKGKFVLSYSFSFWIDPLTKEFKIFWITDEYNDSGTERLGTFFITYSSNNDSWTQIDLPIHHDEYQDLHQCRYSVTNGFLYFLKYNRSTCNYTIIGYDISNELFQEIHLPETEIHSSKQQVVVDLCGDSLALFIYEMRKPRTEVWIMREKGCWIKLFNVGIHNLCRPLGFWKGNEFFISRYTDEMNTELVIYDPVSGKTRKLEVEMVDVAVNISVIPLCYKESLISVDNGCVQTRWKEEALLNCQ